MPLPTEGRKESTRRPPKKVPSFHLTGVKAMKYVEEADTRTKEKKNKVTKEDNNKKEAVNKARAEERKKNQKPNTKQKVTRLR